MDNRNWIVVAGLCMGFVLPVRADYAAGLRAYEQGDFTTAVRELAADAERGHPGAQNLLGLAYALGQGVPQNAGEAMKWFRRAAMQGDDGAQFNLGNMYAKGQGIPIDPVEAARWFGLSAAAGNARAQLNMGVLYFNGQGVARDEVQALMWLQLAAARGNQPAASLRESLLKSLEPARIAQANQLAADWENAHRQPPVTAPTQPAPSAPVPQPQPRIAAAPVKPVAPKAQGNTAEAHHQRGRELSVAGQYKEAIVELSEALRLNPDHALAFNARGFAYYRLRDYQRAIADFSEAIRLRPGYANAYLNRASARKAIGDAAGAAADLEKAK